MLNTVATNQVTMSDGSDPTNQLTVSDWNDPAGDKFAKLAKMLYALGEYLEEKSLSPDITYMMESGVVFSKGGIPSPAFTFRVPNIQQNYAQQIIHPGVVRWCEEYNRFVPKNMIKFRKQRIDVILKLSQEEKDLLCDSTFTEHISTRTIYGLSYLKLMTESSRYTIGPINPTHTGPPWVQPAQPAPVVSYGTTTGIYTNPMYGGNTSILPASNDITYIGTLGDVTL